MLSTRTVLLRLVTIISFSLTTSGCAIFTIDTMHNQPLGPNPAQETRATMNVAGDDLYYGKFIGIALSGGGSRAANFSAAVMFELDEQLQLLDKATAISSVSGSSLPAAYYGLYGRDTSRWNRDEVRTQMKKDFEERWIWSWFLPQNALRYWTTNFSRSDIMKDVLDSNLYHGSTFANMSSGRPHVLINSTSLALGKKFIFSNEKFKKDLNSRIDTYPVANAVMASSAFPGAFHDMTLYKYAASQGTSQEQEYEHLIDGGPFDNLGVTTLFKMANSLPKTGIKETKCLLFVVDAYPYPMKPMYIHTADTRSFIDYFVDSNIAAASDALLSVRRSDLLDELNVGFKDFDSNNEPFHLVSPDDEILLDDDDKIYCGVWHIGLPRLLSPDFQKYAMQGGIPEDRINELATIVNSIPTRYKLTGTDKDGKEITADKLQEYLFTAARYLVNYDRDKNGKSVLEDVREWLGSHDHPQSGWLEESP
jgi:predicted acylesterase/phospholipase RssA